MRFQVLVSLFKQIWLSVSDGYLLRKESYYETEIEKNESDSDPDYYPSSDGSESENFHPEPFEETKKQDLSQMEQCSWYFGLV